MKKQFLTLLFFSLWSGLLAQDLPELSYREQVNSLFEQMDLKEVPSGLLLEFSSPLIDLSATNPEVAIHTVQWRSFYAGLMSAQVNENIRLLHLVSVNKRAKAHQEKGFVPVGILDYEVHRLKPDATEKGLLLYQNNKIFDVSGKENSPYESFRVFAASPLQKFSKEGSVSYIFPKNLFFSDREKEVKVSLEVDFGQGKGFEKVSWDKPVQIHYDEKGVKELTVRCIYDKETQEGKGAIYVAQASQKNGRYSTGTARAFFFPPVTTGRQHAGGTVVVDLNQNNTTGRLRAPFIIVEGFDAGGGFGYRDVVSSEDNFAGDPGNLFVDMEGNSNLRDTIHDHTGLDLVFVDFRTTGADIFSNAQFLKQVIEWVNEQKEGNVGVEPNVLLGMSMGGLVGRVALKEMEDEGATHDTRLFITHDSPHRGANTPPGLQAMGMHLFRTNLITVGPFAFDFDDAADFIRFVGQAISMGLIDLDVDSTLDNLTSLAPRQMLIEHVTAPGGPGFTIPPFGPVPTGLHYNNDVHLDFQTRLDALGFPTLSRNVAISNGSECGIPQDFQPGDVIFRINEGCSMGQLAGNSIITVLADIAVTGAAWAGLLNPIRNPLFTASSLLPGSTRIELDVTVRAVPDRAVAEIYHGKVRAGRRVLWFLPPIMETITEESFNSRADMLPLDNMPGGTSDDQIGSFPDCFHAEGVPFCFIPTVSALNVQGATAPTEYLEAHSRNVLPLPSGLPSTFDRVQNAEITDFVSAPGMNEPHIQFTRRNGEWLFNELIQNTAPSPIPNCFDVCDGLNDLEIIGPDYVCSSPALFTIPGLSPGTPVRWIQNNLDVSEGLGFAQVRDSTRGEFTYTGTLKGEIDIIALIGAGGACGPPARISKRFWFGGTPQEITSLIVSDFCVNAITGGGTVIVQPSITAVPNAGGETWEWEIYPLDDPSDIQTFTTDTETLNNVLHLNADQAYVIRVRAINPCGATEWFEEMILPDCEALGQTAGSTCGNGTLDVAVDFDPTDFDFDIEIGVKDTLYTTAGSTEIINLPFYAQVWDQGGNFIIDLQSKVGSRVKIPSKLFAPQPNSTYRIIAYVPDADGDGMADMICCQPPCEPCGTTGGEEENPLSDPDLSDWEGACVIEGDFTTGTASAVRVAENPIPEVELRVSPNPSNDWVQVLFRPEMSESGNEYQMRIVEISTGRTIAETGIKPNQNVRFSVSHLVPQVYLVQVSDSERSWETRLVVQ